MRPVIRALRATGIAALAVAMLQLGALVTSPIADANSRIAVVTEAVNVRTGPSTSYQRIAVIYPGDKVEKIGEVGVWFKVKYKGRTAYVHSDYLNLSGSTPSKVASGGLKGVRYSIGDLNVRHAPSLSAKIDTMVVRGAKFVFSGRTSGGFAEVTYAGRTRWVWAAYTTPVAPNTHTPQASLPKVTGKMRLTGRLMIRTDDTANFTSIGKLPAGSIIDVTGVKRNGVVQAIYRGEVRWFDADWVTSISAAKPAPVAPKPPAAIGNRYSKKSLNVRSRPSRSSSLLAEARSGTRFQVTGNVSNGYAEIVWKGRKAWVAGQYLIATSGSLSNTGWSQGLDSLLPNGKRIVGVTKEKFPQIRTMYGVRFDPIPDHPSGKAVDLMIPNYKKNQALGWEIANYMRAHASELNIRNIIFSQKIWTKAYSWRGWRPMASRGSDNANHYNHIHITTY